MSRGMLQAFLGKLCYNWKCFHKSLERLQDKREYGQKFAELRQLATLSKGGYKGLFFANESGFNIKGCMPYRLAAQSRTY